MPDPYGMVYYKLRMQTLCSKGAYFLAVVGVGVAEEEAGPGELTSTTRAPLNLTGQILVLPLLLMPCPSQAAITTIVAIPV